MNIRAFSAQRRENRKFWPIVLYTKCNHLYFFFFLLETIAFHGIYSNDPKLASWPGVKMEGRHITRISYTCVFLCYTRYSILWLYRMPDLLVTKQFNKYSQLSFTSSPSLSLFFVMSLARLTGCLLTFTSNAITILYEGFYRPPRNIMGNKNI